METAESFYLNKMMPEIKDLHEEVINAVNQNSEIKELFCGWRVWFSPIIDEPDVLFIGINPGIGEKGSAQFKPNDAFEYTFDTYNYPLKDDTVDIFKDKEISSKLDLCNCVKTNYYYLGSKSFDNDNFFKITDFLGRQSDKKGLGDKFFENSKKWTRQVLEIIKPKLIICEGYQAFDGVTEYALEEKVERDHLDVYSFFSKSINSNIIGYSRYRGGRIRNMELLKCKIKELI